MGSWQRKLPECGGREFTLVGYPLLQLLCHLSLQAVEMCQWHSELVLPCQLLAHVPISHLQKLLDMLSEACFTHL